DAIGLVRQLAALGSWLVPGLTPLPEVHVTCAGCRSAAYLHPDTLRAIVIVEASGPPGRMRIEPGAIRASFVDLDAPAPPSPLPIVERERGLTPPLVITLGPAYDSRLDGRERASGRECYVVSFGPRGGDAPSFRGRAWIDTASFALVRMDAAQTNLRGAIVSSRQRDEFAPVAVGDREAWLPARSTSDQLYQAAG